jgi:hypothetical protein
VTTLVAEIKQEKRQKEGRKKQQDKQRAQQVKTKLEQKALSGVLGVDDGRTVKRRLFKQQR